MQQKSYVPITDRHNCGAAIVLGSTQEIRKERKKEARKHDTKDVAPLYSSV
jgi:hypothetical protein